jgi:murein DD-endopeptidase MepM/ murein hydrolase activator NlpD
VAKRQSILIGLIAVLALTGSSGAPSATSRGKPSAKAVGIQVSVPGQGGASGGVVSAPPDAVGVGGSFAYPADGSIASAGSVSSSVSGAAGSTTTANATIQVANLSLFGGEITASSITVRGSAKAGKGVTGDAKGSAVDGLVVLGQPVAGTPGASVAYGSWGSVSILQQAGEPFAGANGRGFHARVTGLAVHLNADHGGAPAGTDILVGYLEVSAEPGAAPKPKSRTIIPHEAPASKPTAKKNKPRRSSLPPVHQIPFNIFPKLTASRYVFPVYGQASYTNTFGAPRADTGWHHGEDIFAPLGAPILAVADGIVYSVGWNDIGGLRLWLQDLAGNEFYYAHLSAFSPLAVDGREVRAGAVVGFLGNTGDAQSTPYHLHFEIHPVGLLPMGYDGVVNSFPYLSAWRRLEDVSFAAGRGWAPPVPPTATAPRPGALLLGSTDISSASGLEPGSLERALVAPVSAEGDGALIRSG